jgi:hypothetical protein
VATTADSLARTPTEKACLDTLRDVAGETLEPMEGHCVRCFLLCELLAERHGTQIDREVAFCASILHDIGLYDAVSHGGVYVEEAAAVARRITAEHGWDAARSELCAQACERHHSLRSQWEAGAEVECLRLADRIEVTAGLSRGGLGRAQIRDVFSEVPRDGVYKGIAKLVGEALRSRPATIPRVFAK